MRDFSLWLQLAVAGGGIFVALAVGGLLQWLANRGKIHDWD
jgi:hypothetical protein